MSGHDHDHDHDHGHDHDLLRRACILGNKAILGGVARL
jgi:hypothetical protein